MSETQEFRKPLIFSRKGSLKNTTIEVDFLSHGGSAGTLPDFVDGTSTAFLPEVSIADELLGSYSRLFQISGFLQGVPSTQYARLGGGNYCQQEIDVVFSFGLTELKAQLAWMRKGAEQR